MGYGTSLGTSHEDEMSYHLERVASNSLTEKQMSDAQEINDNSKSGDFQSRFYATDQSTMPLEASRKLTDALKLQGVGGSTGEPFETKLTPAEETSFGAWKAQNAPKDSGADYDLRGAFKAGLQPDPETGHWPDTFKKPNHPTFSDQSMYAKDAPDKAGTWDGDRYIPPAVRSTIAEDFFGKGENDIRPALGHFYETVKNAFKLPGDVYSGKVPAGSVQEIERATDLAALMITGPAPVAAKVADGSLGSFMGVRSKTIDKTKLYKAQEMEMNGMHPEDIWEETGTFRGADNRWRQEINDKRSQLKKGGSGLQVTIAEAEKPSWSKVEAAPETVAIPDRFSDLKKAGSLEELIKSFAKADSVPTVLGHILHHPTLYDAYPWLQNIKVYPLPKDSPYYGMARGGNEIHMAEAVPDQFHSTLMHEVQHIIQTHEDFAQGSNPSMFIPKELKGAETNFLKVREEAINNTLEEGVLTSKSQVERTINLIKNDLIGNQVPATEKHIINILKEKYPDQYKRFRNIAESERLLDKAKDDASRLYKSTMGEVESRNVQARMDMDAAMRHLTSPRETESYIMSRQFQHDPHSVDNQGPHISASGPSNDNNIYGRKDFKSYKQAVEDQKIKREVGDSEVHVGDTNYWKGIAEKEKITTSLTDRPNSVSAARKYSEDGKTTVYIRADGRRMVFKDGVQVGRDSLK